MTPQDDEILGKAYDARLMRRLLQYLRPYWRQVRLAIYAHLQKLDLQYYDRNPVGRLMTRVTSDVDALNDLFTSGVVTIFGDVFSLVGIMAVLVNMNWRLALVTF